ncbi:hypothetical protein Mapa_001151 [Marchantia paleacea]|nr:hypothetical protein Mapa_001151 [Marchantia paleacea]
MIKTFTSRQCYHDSNLKNHHADLKRHEEDLQSMDPVTHSTLGDTIVTPYLVKSSAVVAGRRTDVVKERSQNTPVFETSPTRLYRV